MLRETSRAKLMRRTTNCPNPSMESAIDPKAFKIIAKQPILNPTNSKDMRIHMKKDKLSALNLKLKNSKVFDHQSEKEKNLNESFEKNKEEYLEDSTKKNNLFVVRSFNLQTKEKKVDNKSLSRRRGSLYLLSPLKKQNLFEQIKENLNKSLTLERQNNCDEETVDLDMKDQSLQGVIINNKKNNRTYPLSQFAKQTNKQSISSKYYQLFLENLNNSHAKIQELCLSNQIPFNKRKNYLDTRITFYIAKGNNSLLIKDILEKRWWWSEHKEKQVFDSVNLFWSQLKNQQIFEEITQKLTRKERITKDSVNAVSDDQQGVQQTNNKDTSAQYSNYLIHNHFQNSRFFTNKYSLNIFMKSKLLGDIQYHPQTFYISKYRSPEWYDFTRAYFQKQNLSNISAWQIHKGNKLWIIKKVQKSHQDHHFELMNSYKAIKQYISINTTKRQTFIIQEYIKELLLYKGRKFEIKNHLLLTRLNGVLKAYWFRQGIVSIASEGYDSNSRDPFVHLTSDHFQKQHHGFGKYEAGNKISYANFQSQLCFVSKDKTNFMDNIIKDMKEAAIRLINKGGQILNKDTYNQIACFELFELKFVVDQQFKPWLISVHSNPNLQMNCPALERIIPRLIDDTLKLTTDLLFPPPEEWPTNKRQFMSSQSANNDFELIFDGAVSSSQQASLPDIINLLQWNKWDEEERLFSEQDESSSSDNEYNASKRIHTDFSDC